jgi:hypothetical protein
MGAAENWISYTLEGIESHLTEAAARAHVEAWMTFYFEVNRRLPDETGRVARVTADLFVEFEGGVGDAVITDLRWVEVAPPPLDQAQALDERAEAVAAATAGMHAEIDRLRFREIGQAQEIDRLRARVAELEAEAARAGRWVARYVTQQPGLDHVTVDPDRDLLRRALLALRPGRGEKGRPRWWFVHHALLHGSGVSQAICLALGIDPDEVVP